MLNLREAVKSLPKPDMRYCTPEWAEREGQIRKFIEHDYPERFLQWKPCKLSLVKPNADLELAYLQSLPDWFSRWRNAVQESNVGKMPRYSKYSFSSGILLRHAAIMAWFEEVTGKRVDELTHVLEFGGGHGSMCRLFHNLGFKGQYVIYDLPALCLLQQYYLQENKIEGVESTWEFDALPAYVAEFTLETSAFIATWSLSESPFSIRDVLFPVIMEFANIVVASQNQIREMDNIAYFKKWEESLHDMDWHWKSIRKVAWIAASR